MRQAREAVRVGDAGARQRPVVRRDHVLDRTVELRDEDGRHPVGTGGDVDRIGPEVDAVRIGDVHPAVEVEERRLLAVDRDLDLFPPIRRVQGGTAAAEKLAGRLVVERDAEAILAVGREGVRHRDAAARAVRGALDLIALRHPARHLVDGLDRAGRGVARREPADLAGRAEIAVHQRRRQHLNIGDVVEVGALGVERQIVARVDVETQQVTNRPRVLGAVQTLKAAAARIGIGGGRRVQARLELRGEACQSRFLWPPDAGRRHQAGPQLADHALGHLGLLDGHGDLERRERQVPGAEPVVVATPAGAVDDGLRRLHRLDRTRRLHSLGRHLGTRRRAGHHHRAQRKQGSEHATHSLQHG